MGFKMVSASLQSLKSGWRYEPVQWIQPDQPISSAGLSYGSKVPGRAAEEVVPDVISRTSGVHKLSTGVFRGQRGCAHDTRRAEEEMDALS